MNESDNGLGQALGLLLIQSDKTASQPTIGGMISGTYSPDQPEPQSGYMHLGAMTARDLPPEALHDYARSRNTVVLDLIAEYARMTEGNYFGLAMGHFRVRSSLPLLDRSISDHPEYGAPHSEHMARSAEFHKMTDPNSIAALGPDSIASGFLIPVYQIYENFYAQGGARHRDKYKNYQPPANFTRDMAGWKNYILSCTLPATRCFSKPLTAYIPLEAFKRHAYIVGGSGSGKSELMKLLVHHLINAKEAQNYSAVVIDPHGDLADEIARFGGKNAEKRVIYFNPALSKFETPSIDIFNPPNFEEETIDTMAGNLADAFSEIVADSSLSAQMRTLLIPCISVLLRRKNSSLQDLQRFMIEDQNADLLKLGQQSPNSGQAAFFRVGFMEKTYETTKRSVYTRLQTLLNSTVFRRMINPAASLSLEAELNAGKIIVFSLAKASLGNDVSQAFGRLLIAQIKNLGFRRQFTPKGQRTPTFVFVDECQNFVGESIEDTLTELRKYGIHMVLANQVIGQNMSSQLTNILLSNTAVKITGYNGDKSLAIMAKETGAEMPELKKLTTGKFWAKVNVAGRITQPFLFKAPTYLLGNKSGLTKENWYERKKRGWHGYIKNTVLDASSAKSTREQPVEDFEGISGHTTTPDYVETPDGVGKPRKPRFDI